MAKAKQKAKKKYEYFTKAVHLPDGTRKYLRAKTQKELDDKVLKTLVLVNAGVDICSEETFGHFSQMWYDLYKKPYLRENSLISIRNTLNFHILPIIGSYRMLDITPMHIQSILAGLSDKSNSLQSKVLIILRNIFKAAEENGLVAKSPVSSLLKPGGKKTPEKETISAENTQLLLSRVTNFRAKTFLLIALNTGMRRGEILALTWDDIDFEKKMIFVRKNAILGRGHDETKINNYLKTEAGKRDLPLTEELEAWLRMAKKLSHSKYVMAMRNHKPLTQSSYRTMWKLIDRELPDTHITAHILRHTFITRLFEAGLDIKEIQYLAGHSTVDMTLKIYTHYDRKNRALKTAERVREALRTSA